MRPLGISTWHPAAGPRPAARRPQSEGGLGPSAPPAAASPSPRPSSRAQVRLGPAVAARHDVRDAAAVLSDLAGLVRKNQVGLGAGDRRPPLQSGRAARRRPGRLRRRQLGAADARGGGRVFFWQRVARAPGGRGESRLPAARGGTLRGAFEMHHGLGLWAYFWTFRRNFGETRGRPLGGRPDLVRFALGMST